MRTVFEIDGESFIFVDDGQIERVREDLRNAVRSGGEFVRMGDGSPVEVLVTASTRIRVQEVPEVIDFEPDDLDPLDELLVDFDLD